MKFKSYGILRIDIGKLSIVENVNYETGDWKSYSFAFDFTIIEFGLRLKTFLKN